jgi:hypothetical protein
MTMSYITVAVNCRVILLSLILPREHIISRYFYFTIAGLKYPVAAVKCCPVLHFSVVIFSGPPGSLIPTLFHYPSRTDSVKLVCNVQVIMLPLLNNASKGSYFIQLKCHYILAKKKLKILPHASLKVYTYTRRK